MENFKTMPLRFRVWDKEKQEFVTWDTDYCFARDDDNKLCFSEVDWYAKDLVEQDNDRFIVSQDTGLKDKNGKSIYSGDIIRWPISTNKKRYHYVSIVYRDGKVMYDHGPVFGSQFSRYEEVALIAEDEVVGNIWQNPELLEEK